MRDKEAEAWALDNAMKATSYYQNLKKARKESEESRRKSSTDSNGHDPLSDEPIETKEETLRVQ